MLLQGDLQKVFDALYHLGVIDPVLELDWNQEFAEIAEDPMSLSEIIKVVNESHGDHEDLMEQLQPFAVKDLSHLAMLVAQELASFQAERVLH